MNGQVTRVIDGEAIEVRIGDRLEIVRYIGVGTPEILHPSGGPDRYREAARAANARLVADKPLQLMFDMQVRDRAGRLLAYVYAGDLFLNAELVGAGYAEVATSHPTCAIARPSWLASAMRVRRSVGSGPTRTLRDLTDPGRPASTATRGCRSIFIPTTAAATSCSRIHS